MFTICADLCTESLQVLEVLEVLQRWTTSLN